MKEEATASTQPKVLLIDGTTATSPGMANLQKELVRGLDAACPARWELVWLTTSVSPEGVALRHTKIVKLDPLGKNLLKRWRWYNISLPRIIQELGVSVVYSLSGIVSRRMSRACRTITTVNNMVPFSPELKGKIPLFSARRVRLWLLLLQYQSSVKRADALVMHSKYAADLVTRGSIQATAKTTVVFSGVSGQIQFDPLNPPEHPNNGKEYLLYLSAFYDYKNHLRLVEAYAEYVKERDTLPELLLAGFPADKNVLSAVEQAIWEKELQGRVRYIGVLPEKSIAAWLHYATINVFPSLCETNSVVLAEVLGVNGVLACSRTPPMPEICGEAAWYFDPWDIEDIRSTLERLLGEPESQVRLREKASQRKVVFSWDMCCALVWEIAVANN